MAVVIDLGALMDCSKFSDWVEFESLSAGLILLGIGFVIFLLIILAFSLYYFKRRKSLRRKLKSIEISRASLSVFGSVSELHSAAARLSIHSKAELRSVLIAVDARLKIAENRLNFLSSSRIIRCQLTRKLWLAAVFFMVGITVVFWANIHFGESRPNGDTAGQWFERSAAIAAVISMLISGLMEECVTAINEQMEALNGGFLLEYDRLKFWAYFWRGCALILSIVATLCWGYGSVFLKIVCS